MQSDAATVDAYIDEAPPERRTALRELRRLCREHLVGFEEGMFYGMAGYRRNGVVEVAFASQKNNLALYILQKEVLDVYRSRFPASAVGKGCIRYQNPARIDFEVVEALLIATRERSGPVC